MKTNEKAWVKKLIELAESMEGDVKVERINYLLGFIEGGKEFVK